MPVSLDETIRPLPIHLGTEPEQIGESIQKNIDEMQADGQKILLEAEVKNVKSSQDEAVLSKESQSPKEAERVRSQMERWSIEDSPLWQLLLNWNPAEGSGSMDGKLKQLMELYQALLTEILMNSSGSNQQQQMVLLESALSIALNRYVEVSLKELEAFIESYGKPNQLEQLKSELFRAVTGHRLSPKESREFWRMGAGKNQTGTSAGKDAAGSQMRGMNGRGGERAGRFTTATQETIIYQPGKKAGTILAETLPASQTILKKDGGGLLDTTLGAKAAGKTADKGPNQLVSQSTNQPLNQTKGEISVRDMKLSKQFVTYVESENNPLELGVREFGGKSEELKGVLASILQIQCREFSNGAKIGDTMSHILLDGVDRYIDKEVRREETAVNSQTYQRSLNSGQPRKFQYNHVYKTYAHIMEIYDRYRLPNRAISEGIRFAMETYQKRSTDEADSKDGELRFFKVGNTGQPMSFWADLREAKILLERNWGHFMAYTVHGGRIRRQAVSLIPLEKGFWGMFIKPDAADLPMFYKHYLYVFMGVLVFGLIVLLILKGI